MDIPTISSDGVQYNVAVNRVFVCKDVCSPSLIYNTGVVPSGEKEAGTIIAGTNGGSGTVTIAANQNTTLVAYKSITLVPNFNAVPGSGSLYLKAEPCPSERKSWPDSLDGSNFKIEPTYEADAFGGTQLNYNGRNSYTEYLDNWTAYYNNGQLVLTRKNAMLPQGNVVVYDMAGKEIAKRNIRRGQADIVIQSPLKQNNVYIIRMITKEKSYSKKILIQNKVACVKKIFDGIVKYRSLLSVEI